LARKSFTVDEANALIPALQKIFERIERRKEVVRAHGKKIEVLGLLWGEKLAEVESPDHDEFIDHKRSIEKEIAEIERIIRDEIQSRGIRFPMGGIENGLLDFPTTFEGRWVYLCWKNGEPELSYWHETDAGYPGRQPITSRQRTVMGRDDDAGTIDDSALDF
jgi:hypothetical protein